MDNWNARQLGFVMTNLAEMYAAMADVEALKAEVVAMQANDANVGEHGAIYTEQAYLDVAARIKEKADMVRAIAGQMGANTLNMS